MFCFSATDIYGHIHKLSVGGYVVRRVLTLSFPSLFFIRSWFCRDASVQISRGLFEIDIHTGGASRLVDVAICIFGAPKSI